MLILWENQIFSSEIQEKDRLILLYCEKIFNIYTSYGTQEKQILTRVALDVISDTATLFNSSKFFDSRSII